MQKNAHKKILFTIGKAAEEAGVKAWVVGGFVRDLYLGKKTFDIDICVEGSTKPLIDFCVKEYCAQVTNFNDFGTARVQLKNGLKVDFVTCRREVYLKPAALPKVTPSGLTDDLYRRDFTANAWALSILPKEFFKSFDLFHSQKAIDGKFIKVLHNKSFIDDPTRIFRALRFAARFGWKVEKSTETLLKTAVKEGAIGLLSRERIRQELFKILEEKDPLPSFVLMDKFKVTPFIYYGLKCPKSILKVKGLYARLAVLALSLKEEGDEFLKSLHISRAVYMDIKELLDIYNSKEVPLKDISVKHKKLLKIFNPSLPSYRLKKNFLTGEDLLKAGYKGKEIKEALSKAGRLQYSGKIKNKKQALNLLAR